MRFLAGLMIGCLVAPIAAALTQLVLNRPALYPKET